MRPSRDPCLATRSTSRTSVADTSHAIPSCVRLTRLGVALSATTSSVLCLQDNIHS